MIGPGVGGEGSIEQGSGVQLKACEINATIPVGRRTPVAVLIANPWLGPNQTSNLVFIDSKIRGPSTSSIEVLMNRAESTAHWYQAHGQSAGETQTSALIHRML